MRSLSTEYRNKDDAKRQIDEIGEYIELLEETVADRDERITELEGEVEDLKEQVATLESEAENETH